MPPCMMGPSDRLKVSSAEYEAEIGSTSKMLVFALIALAMGWRDTEFSIKFVRIGLTRFHVNMVRVKVIIE